MQGLQRMVLNLFVEQNEKLGKRFDTLEQTVDNKLNAFEVKVDGRLNAFEKSGDDRVVSMQQMVSKVTGEV